MSPNARRLLSLSLFSLPLLFFGCEVEILDDTDSATRFDGNGTWLCTNASSECGSLTSSFRCTFDTNASSITAQSCTGSHLQADCTLSVSSSAASTVVPNPISVSDFSALLDSALEDAFSAQTYTVNGNYRNDSTIVTRISARSGASAMTATGSCVKQ